MYNREYTPDRITELKPNEVFVFGSNLAGSHSGGAVRLANSRFGAIWGQGVGLQGQSYGIPTMQGGVETIKPYVVEFIRFAKQHRELKFLVTKIGCGIAGFTADEIAPLFKDAIDVENVILPKEFDDIIISIIEAKCSFIKEILSKSKKDIYEGIVEPEYVRIESALDKIGPATRPTLCKKYYDYTHAVRKKIFIFKDDSSSHSSVYIELYNADGVMSCFISIGIDIEYPANLILEISQEFYDGPEKENLISTKDKEIKINIWG